MKSLQGKLILAFTLLMGSIFAGLGIVLSQLFPVYVEQSVKSNAIEKAGEISFIVEQSNITVNDALKEEITLVLSSDPNGSDFYDIRKKLWQVLLIVLLGAFIITIMLSYRLTKRHAQPIDNVTEVAIELAKGNYRARAYEDDLLSTAQLSTSINILARNLQELFKVREMEKERLNTLIENMGSALMMIDRDGQISIVNKPFVDQFDFSAHDVQDELFKSVGLPEELEKFIDYVFLMEASSRKQMTLVIQQDIKHMEVYGAPVIGEHGRWLGVVIVMHDISDLVRLEQIRKDFVANVSHELRTPITSIKGFSETLLDGAMKDEKTLLTFLEIIYKESNRLQMLIQDLLELSKIEQHGFSVDLVKTNLQEVMMRAAEMMSPRIDEKDMTFVTNMKSDVVVNGDMNRLIQVVMNLLANAITYSAEKTSVYLSLHESETHGIIIIRDEGIGMDKKEIPRIFERFYRIDRARSRNSGGTGLGLAIVKHLIEAHNGRIFVESEPGKGTQFKILIPKNQAT
ncbi:two-component system histidine kinase PnpS [Paenisporosarcina sp. TG-14]|uniref:two-component system histidine kinase PnpS n=1 Tax=Paenisporosarcina sp. TG-14 TaxID=1231057 RepID=UPI0002F93BF2|nr:ATP-binding protein [Paenisporosarcina sp. TG-14]